MWAAYAAGQQRLGEEHGDNTRLSLAIEYYEKILEIWIRDRVPLGWAATHNNLGNAFVWLGERESGTERGRGSLYRAAGA